MPKPPNPTADKKLPKLHAHPQDKQILNNHNINRNLRVRNPPIPQNNLWLT